MRRAVPALSPFEKKTPPGTSGCKSLHPWNGQHWFLAFGKELFMEHVTYRLRLRNGQQERPASEVSNT